MCSTCGCQSGEPTIVDVTGDHARQHAAGEAHTHGAEHAAVPVHVHAAEMTGARMLRIEQDILARNDSCAAHNRSFLRERGIFALNLVSSPGAGKTALLVQTIRALGDPQRICVIEGDQQTSNDAERIRASGVRAIQINTGKGCHLDAHMVGHALERLDPPQRSMLMIENVGNLVCPAAFDLGEAHKVVVLSVTEGEDKPLKYPDMFRRASIMLLNKVDLLPYLAFDAEMCIANARRTNPDIEVIGVSATSGAGMTQWLAWLERGVQDARARGESFGPAPAREWTAA